MPCKYEDSFLLLPYELEHMHLRSLTINLMDQPYLDMYRKQGDFAAWLPSLFTTISIWIIQLTRGHGLVLSTYLQMQHEAKHARSMYFTTQHLIRNQINNLSNMLQKSQIRFFSFTSINLILNLAHQILLFTTFIELYR